MKFTLEMELGNESMLIVGDVARAVLRVSCDIVKRFPGDQSTNAMIAKSVPIMDCNGSKIGSWVVSED